MNYFPLISHFSVTRLSYDNRWEEQVEKSSEVFLYTYTVTKNVAKLWDISDVKFPFL